MITAAPTLLLQTRAQNEAIESIARITGGTVSSVHVTEEGARAVIRDGLPSVEDPEVEYRVLINADGDIRAWEESFTPTGLRLLAADGIVNPDLGTFRDAWGANAHLAAVEAKRAA